MDILDTIPEAGEDARALLEEIHAAAKEELPLPNEAYDRFNEAD